MSHPTPPWLRVLARADFVAAVLLTVVAPLVLLVRAALGRRPELPALLRYWRASSLLMVTVYLLVGERRYAAICGVAARLLIALALARPLGDDGPTEAWRSLARAYCLAGAAANLPMLLDGDLAAALRSAYAEPPREYAALLHPGADPEALGRVGDLGLLAFAAGATAEIALSR